MRKFRQLLAKCAFRHGLKIHRPEEDFTAQHLGPTNGQSVYWVGHSLMQECVAVAEQKISLFNLMRSFAESRQFTYKMYDHTLYGAPLSLQWRGKPHSFSRTAPEMDATRADFPREAAHFDTFVLTEVVPVKNVIQLEFSAYYLQQFYDTIFSVNTNARVYIYESWDYLHGTGASLTPDEFDWGAAMTEQRALWERISDEASYGVAVTPSISDQLMTFIRPKRAQKDRSPIFIVPVGQVFKRLYDMLCDEEKGQNITLVNGRLLRFSDLFSNPYTNWLEAKAKSHTDKTLDASSSLTLKDPSKALDDIHPSAIGIYIVALVHFATLYRASPVGLPTIALIGEEVAERLQRIVWDIVCADPRAGVKAL